MNTMTRMKALAAALVLAAGAAAAGPEQARERLNEEIQAALLRLLESGEVAPADLATLTVAAEPVRRTDFGAIVDLRPAPESPGVPVLAVTPGGNAASLGVRAGDRIMAVDGVPLHGTDAAPAQVLRAQLDGGGPRLSLTVLRDGEVRVLNGPVQAWSLPGYRLELQSALAGGSMAAARPPGQGCGRISLAGNPPRRQNIFPATLVFIDGETPKPFGGPAFRVPAGRHVLTVDEQIDWSRTGMKEQHDKRKRLLDREGYRSMEIVIEPGMTYRLGARFIPEESHRVLENAYWEPVIWAEAAEPCS